MHKQINQYWKLIDSLLIARIEKILPIENEEIQNKTPEEIYLEIIFDAYEILKADQTILPQSNSKSPSMFAWFCSEFRNEAEARIDLATRKQCNSNDFAHPSNAEKRILVH